MTWRAAAYAVFAVVAVLVAATFQDYGISWDEQLQNTYGRKLLAFYTSGFQDMSAFSYVNLFLYGGFFDLTAAIANLVSPFDEYATRHLIGGIFFLAGLFGGWLLARLLAGERAAFIAVLCLATTPLLYGHGFINPKDSPLAWLAVWTMYFACRFLARPAWGASIGLGVSLGLALGTRVIALAYAGYLGLVLILVLFAQYRAGGMAATTRTVKAYAPPLAAAAVISIAVMGVMWPWALQAPFNMFAALGAFTDFPFYPRVLWNGVMIPADQMPWTYLPGLLALQLPEHVLTGLVVAAVMAVVSLKPGAWAETRVQQYLLVILSVAVPLDAYIILNPTIYNGLRHFLFVVPPLVILGAVGLNNLLTLAMRYHRAAAAALGVLFTMGIGGQIAAMISLHPYQYVAYNGLMGGARGAQDRFELDYWGTSLKETSRALAAYVNANAGGAAKVFVCGDRTSVGHFLPASIQITEDLREADFYMGMTGVPCRDVLDVPLKRVIEIGRAGVTLAFVLDLRHP